MSSRKQNKKHKKWPWILGAVLIIGAIGGIKLYRSLNNYDSICLALQKGAFPGMEANSFEPRAEAKEEQRTDGAYIHTEVQFGTEFPNSYLDIYYAGTEIDETRPTFIYWHGGGHIFGDKNLGDPLSPNADLSAYLYEYIRSQGFNFISVNYCFAPEYRYPCQILHYNQALDYLNTHAEELHLNMDNVVLGGSSGGAVYTSQWVMLLTSKAYLTEFNKAVTETGYTPIDKPALEPSQVKALMLEAPPMIVDGMNEKTQILYKCWYGADDMLGLWYTRLTHIVEYVTEDFIPCFITAGNTECYPEDAKELHEKLTELGVEHSYYYVDSDVEVLNHGYLSSFQTSPHARESLEQCMTFIKTLVGIE